MDTRPNYRRFKKELANAVEETMIAAATLNRAEHAALAEPSDETRDTRYRVAREAYAWRAAYENGMANALHLIKGEAEADAVYVPLWTAAQQRLEAGVYDT